MAEHDEELHTAYQIFMACYRPERLVFVDETGCDRNSSARVCGWTAETVLTANQRDFFVRGIRYITSTGVHVTSDVPQRIVYVVLISETQGQQSQRYLPYMLTLPVGAHCQCGAPERPSRVCLFGSSSFTWPDPAGHD